MTVFGVHDANRADEQVTITFSGPDVRGGTFTVDVTDDDLGLRLPSSPVTVTEGGDRDLPRQAGVPARTGRHRGSGERGHRRGKTVDPP